ncbi:MAG: FHA domain-containing protein [Anaerolineae bacterium]|nr:FHA domain-containing protein [Anaerolineae bacterium]
MRLVVEVGSTRAGGSPGHGGGERPGASREFQIDKAQATIGRGVECDVVLAEQGASRQHARLHYNMRVPPGPGEPQSDSASGSGTWYLVDLGTTNGTFLNGRRLEAHHPEPLKVGDRVSIGSSVLVVHDLKVPLRTDKGAGRLMELHPAVRGMAALLFVAGLVVIVALLVLVLRPEPHVQEAVLPTAASPLDVITTVIPSGVPQDLIEPIEQMLTSPPIIPLLGTPEP